MTIFSCWYHFKNNVRTKYLRLKEQWETVHDIIGKLLQCNREEIAGTLIEDAIGAIGKMSDETMKEMHTKILDEIVRTRLLFKLKSFTQGWTSQSPGETMNSIVTKLKIESNCPLTVALDKLICYAELWKARKTTGTFHHYLEMR